MMSFPAGRIYIRRNESAIFKKPQLKTLLRKKSLNTLLPEIIPRAWPGHGWQQSGPLATGIDLPNDSEIMAVINVDASRSTRGLSKYLPNSVNFLYLYGHTSPKKQWLKELSSMPFLKGLAMASLPDADVIEAIAGCKFLTTLTLGHPRILNKTAIKDLGCLEGMKQLHHLCLHNVDVRGRLPFELMIKNLVVEIAHTLYPDCITWQGMEWFDQVPELRRISLSVPGLDPNCLKYMACLSNIEQISLRWCRVTGEVLKSWRNLGHLEILDIEDTELSSPDLAEIPLPLSLRNLVLPDITLDDPELRSLAGLPFLERMAFQGDVKGSFGSLKGSPIVFLNISLSRSKPLSFRGLSRLDNLRTLILDETPTDDTTLAQLGALSRLEELSVNGCKDITFKNCDLLRNFQNMQSLDISNTGANADVFRVLSKSRNLKFLHGTDLHGIDPEQFLTFSSSLNVLHLDRTPIHNSTCAAISSCKNLMSLSLGGCHLESDGLKRLQGITSLRSLRISLSQVLPPWIGDLPHLKELSIENLTVDRQAYATLLRCQNLTRLELRRCHLKGSMDAAIPENFFLEALALPECTFADNKIFGVLSHFKYLRYLDLSDSGVDDEDLPILHSDSIETILLYQTQVTVSGLLGLGELPKLDQLLGIPMPKSEKERKAMLERFPTLWSLMTEFPARIFEK